MMNTSDTPILSEKYRPQVISDCILPARILDFFRQIVQKNNLPNLLLSGSSGVGKTTIAKAVASELGSEVLFINASEDSGIDTLRTKIRDFASANSLNGAVRIVILDEADYLQQTSTQPALRSFMEEFSTNCRFILTCNTPNRILPALKSRCTEVNFNLSSNESPKMAAKFFKRLVGILRSENIEYDEKVIVSLIKRYFPDFRRILNEIQRVSLTHEKIDESVLSVNRFMKDDLSGLIKSLQSGSFKDMRKWVAENSDIDPNSLYRELYDELYNLLESASIPQAVLIIHEYLYKNAFVADKEINMVACMTELMAECKFKES